jgi:Uncharacterized protein conserved in bacteria (DUF2064)
LNDTQKILLYAPPDNKGRNTMIEILNELGLSLEEWHLIPTTKSNNSNGTNDDANYLNSSNLTKILQHAFETTRQSQTSVRGPGPIVFLGMDAPEVPIHEIVKVVHGSSSHPNTALLCPADDGGYGMLSIPDSVDPGSSRIFDGVLWSHPLTAVSQIKALTDWNVHVVLGPLMHDIDDEQDVRDLVERLRNGPKSDDDDDDDGDGNNILGFGIDPPARNRTRSVLTKPSALLAPTATKSHQKPVPTTALCKYTRQALISLELLPRDLLCLNPAEMLTELIQAWSGEQGDA